MKVFIVTHKFFEKPRLDNGYVSICAGASYNKVECDYYDNTGENISDKNSSYNEMTATYWVWKNIKEENIVGIVHYRRYFTKGNADKILKKKEIERLLYDNDIIVSPQSVHSIAMKNMLIKSGIATESQYKLLRDTIKEIEPDSIEAFDSFMAGKMRRSYNMLICKKKLFDDYCRYMFSVLMRYEEKLKNSKEEVYSRLYGSIAEFLLEVYILQGGVKVRDAGVYGMGFPQKGLRAAFEKLRAWSLYYFNNPQIFIMAGKLYRRICPN